jgi:hypothetical protein
MTEDEIDVVILQVEAAKLGRVAIWTVFETPADYPTGFVARMFELTGAGPKPTDKSMKSIDLPPIREKLERAGLVCMPREAADEPDIVESWIPSTPGITWLRY